MSRIAEYRDIAGQPRSVETTIETRMNNGREYRLVHESTGWTTAGSMARMVEADRWGVLFYVGGAANGRWFRTLAEARAMFDTWAPKAVEDVRS